jgi:hypothetical protein
LSRIERGYAVSRPTIGYVETTRGKWIMDPDQNVRTSIDLIFDLYLRFKSTRRVEKYFNEHGLRFPRRRRGELVWLPLSGLDVIRILKNPGYTGDYVFGRLREVEAGDPPRKHFEQRPRSEWAVYPNHHAAYVTRERWERIQMMLAERRPSVRPPLGKGAALLQGLVRCARCDRWMRTVYSDRRGADRIPRYLCHPVDYMRVARHHLSCSALLLDRTVTNIVLSAISPPNIDSALDALKSAALESEALQQVHHRHLRRLEDEVADARRQHALADPNSRLVRADLEARFEEALRRRDEFRQQLTLLAAPPATSIGPDAAKELVTLAADVRRLWQAPSTTNEDRKQLLRTALSQILVVASTEQYLDIELVWAGGRREPHRIPRPKAVDQLVRDLHGEGLRPSEILDRLLSKDVPNRSGKPLTEQAIRMKLYSLGLNQKTDRLRDLILIRQLLCDGRTRREILDILKEHTSEPIRGKWTAAKLSDAIRSLRLGLYRGDIEPLPSDLVSNSRWPIPAAAVALIRHGREHGASWESIAEKLNTSGFKPPRSARFSPVQTRELFKRLMVQYGVDPPGPSAYSTASNESVCVHLRAWSPSQTATEMASKLNALGLRTKFGRGWTPQAVGLKCRTLGLSARRNEPHQTTILDSPPNLPGDR